MRLKGHSSPLFLNFLALLRFLLGKKTDFLDRFVDQEAPFPEDYQGSGSGDERSDQVPVPSLAGAPGGH